MKKFLVTMLALVMIFALAFSVSAAATSVDSEQGGSASITIQNTTSEATYKIYKVFNATVDGEGNIAYTLNGETELSAAMIAAGFSVDSAGNVGYSGSTLSSDAIAALAAYATETNLAATVTGTGGTVTVTNLTYGYYYITTTTGTVVTVDSTNPNATVVDKNEGNSTPDKKEKTTSDTTYVDGGSNASIGDTVNYQVTGTIGRYEGETKVVNLVFTDTMSDGLTYQNDLKITVAGEEVNVDVTATTDQDTGVTTITFTLPTVDSDGNFLYASGAKYVITYSAVINDNAVVGQTENNTIVVKYNNDNTVGQDTTDVTTYAFTLQKVNSADEDDQEVLTGAEFSLWTAAEGGTQIKVTYDEDAGVYRVNPDAATSDAIEAGTATIEGLAAGTYYLQEDVAPKGYNKLTTRTAVTVSATTTTVGVDVQVVNNAGTELPSTGGTGTTIFYIVGSVLVVGAGVLLVTKKRMSAAE